MEEEMDVILNIIEGEYRRKYAKKHGYERLMSAYDSVHWKDDEAEKVYKACLERDITWEEYKGYKTDLLKGITK